MSYDCANFEENDVSLAEPVQTTDTLVELYEEGEYLTTLTVDRVLKSLQQIIDEELDGGESAIEIDGDEWVKASSLRIAAAAFRKWVDENSL